MFVVRFFKPPTERSKAPDPVLTKRSVYPDETPDVESVIALPAVSDPVWKTIDVLPTAVNVSSASVAIVETEAMEALPDTVDVSAVICD